MTRSTPRATKRPSNIKPPAHWTKSDPPPAPVPISADDRQKVENGPTRYGDWELKGIAIDF